VHLAPLHALAAAGAAHVHLVTLSTVLTHALPLDALATPPSAANARAHAMRRRVRVLIARQQMHAAPVGACNEASTARAGLMRTELAPRCEHVALSARDGQLLTHCPVRGETAPREQLRAARAAYAHGGAHAHVLVGAVPSARHECPAAKDTVHVDDVALLAVLGQRGRSTPVSSHQAEHVTLSSATHEPLRRRCRLAHGLRRR
jgi:hypothetical protein